MGRISDCLIQNPTRIRRTTVHETNFCVGVGRNHRDGDVLMLTGVFMMASRQAQAMAACGKQTGLPCGDCHTNSAGGGKLNDFGERFKANGNKLPEK
ncbi:MAG: hypothetical protein ACLQIQ_14060 [Beijerinckiaceae bacterium]